LYICGIWAKSHETILRVPRTEEISARGVGRQMWRCDEIAVRKGDVGSQWSGRDPDMRCCKIDSMMYSIV
jgi:hypothetical protein